MQLSAETSRFLVSPVTIVIASSDSERRPTVGRGLGIRVGSPTHLDVIFSRWQWPRVAADLAQTRRLAVTCARPSDYVTYQVKGNADLRAAHADDVAHATRYCQEIRAVLAGLGVAPSAVAQWTAIKDLAVAMLEVTEAYVQTPGPKAGTAL